MDPKFILIQPEDKSLLPVCYEVDCVLQETTRTLLLSVKAKGNVLVNKKKNSKHQLFERRPYGYGRGNHGRV